MKAVGVESPADLNGLLHLGNSFSNVPGGTANWTFDRNSDYNGPSGSVAITLTKASSTTAVTCTTGPFTYSGAAQTPCSVSVTGAGALNPVVNGGSIVIHTKEQMM
jgi:hypothetical protein